MEQQTITRDLEYFFSDEERIDMSKQLAAEIQNKQKLEDSKKAVVSQYGSQINEKQEGINQLANKLASGYEFRKIGCSIQWHTPDRNKKTIIREDTGAEWVERMTEYDHDLFNQWEEKQAADLENAGEHEFEQEPIVEEEVPAMTDEELAYEEEKLLAESGENAEAPEAEEVPAETHEEDSTLFPG